MSKLNKEKDYGTLIYKGKNCNIYVKNNGPGSDALYTLEYLYSHGFVTIKTYEKFIKAYNDAIVFDSSQTLER